MLQRFVLTHVDAVLIDTILSDIRNSLFEWTNKTVTLAIYTVLDCKNVFGLAVCFLRSTRFRTHHISSIHPSDIMCIYELSATQHWKQHYSIKPEWTLNSDAVYRTTFLTSQKENAFIRNENRIKTHSCLSMCSVRYNIHAHSNTRIYVCTFIQMKMSRGSYRCYKKPGSINGSKQTTSYKQRSSLEQYNAYIEETMEMNVSPFP